MPGSTEWFANRLYGTGTHPNAKQKNIQIAKELAKEGAYFAPGIGNALSLQDSWNASGRGAQALQSGNYGKAVGDYGEFLTGLLGALPGAGIVARGSNRAAAVYV